MNLYKQGTPGRIVANTAKEIAAYNAKGWFSKEVIEQQAVDANEQAIDEQKAKEEFEAFEQENLKLKEALKARSEALEVELEKEEAKAKAKEVKAPAKSSSKKAPVDLDLDLDL